MTDKKQKGEEVNYLTFSPFCRFRYNEYYTIFLITPSTTPQILKSIFSLIFIGA
jgi:hypothetical protein